MTNTPSEQEIWAIKETIQNLKANIRTLEKLAIPKEEPLLPGGWKQVDLVYRAARNYRDQLDNTRSPVISASKDYSTESVEICGEWVHNLGLDQYPIRHGETYRVQVAVRVMSKF